MNYTKMEIKSNPQYTKGKWSVSDNGDRDGYHRLSVVTDTTRICELSVRRNNGELEANAHLIAAAVNACIKLNPDNPMAVAESIGEMYEALKAIMSCQTDASVYKMVERYRWVLAKAEGKEC